MRRLEYQASTTNMLINKCFFSLQFFQNKLAFWRHEWHMMVAIATI